MKAVVRSVIIMALLFCPLNTAVFAEDCTPLPTGTGADFEITKPYCVTAGSYNYGFVNIHSGGKLTFQDGNIDFWAKSILVENKGSLIAGAPGAPIAKKITIHLYGKETDEGITCKTTTGPPSSPDFICGVAKDRWTGKGGNGYALRGDVEDQFYAYEKLKTDQDRDKQGKEINSFFGRKVLGVSYGGTLQMFGKKGATYPEPDRTAIIKAPLKKRGDTHMDMDRFVDWKAGTKIVIYPKGKPNRRVEVQTIKSVDIDANDRHASLILEAPGITYLDDGKDDYVVVAMDPSGTSWARLEGDIDNKSGKTLTLDREVDWEAGDRIVVTTTDYLPGHSEELEIIDIKDKRKITFKADEQEGIKYPHNGTKYPLQDKHNIPKRLTDEGFKIREVETRAAVALLTRNIRIVSEGNNYGESLPVAGADGYFGGHTIVRQGFNQFQMQGVELRQLGQGGRAARGPVNFFLTRQAPADTYVRDCSINESMTHWIELRGAHNVLLERNVGYKSIGHGFVLAEGTEIENTLRGNIGIFARAAVENDGQNPRKVPGIAANPASGKDTLIQDAGDAVHPSVFFIANGYNTFDHNMAAGAGTCGACYWIVPAKHGALSGDQFSRDRKTYAGIQSTDMISAPLKSFRGNFCSTAMHSLITIGSVGTCDGVFDADKADKKGVIRPLFDSKLDSLNPKTIIDFGANLVAGIRADCDNIKGDCVKRDCDQYYNPRDKEQMDKYNKCSEDCSKMAESCNSICNKGSTGMCAVTVIEDYTSSFHWASTNVSAIWLRTNWFLMTDSVLTDVLNGGLTMVSGGTYDQVINGYWALTRKSAFIGNTQPWNPMNKENPGNPYATPAGPVNWKSPLKCAPSEKFCALIDEGISFPTENFSVYQRLYNIYDGPVYQETNAFLNINKIPIDCNLGPKEGQRICNSLYMYGSGGRGLGIPRAKEASGDIKIGDCILPNAAIGWKQPNGFYYPPAFYSRNLHFDNVDLRHFIIIPLFEAGTYNVNAGKVTDGYCTYNQNDAKGLFANSWTDVDRQTELNDEDGTLSGLANTISVNNDEFFSVPLQPDECLSEKTCFQVPYDYVTAVVFPDEATKKRKINDEDYKKEWGDDCKTQACYGVPIYRQLLKDGEEAGPQQMARMMGGGIFQRSTMIYNNGVYFIDTAVSEGKQKKTVKTAPDEKPMLNKFIGGKKYDFFLLYAKSDGKAHTRVTFQVYVGKNLDEEAFKKNNVKMIRVYTKKPEPLGDSKYTDGIVVTALTDWENNWPRAYDRGTGIMEVTIDMSPFQGAFEAAKEENCRPASFCKWDSDKKQCKYANNPINPTPYDASEGDKVCQWAVKAPECPKGGCYGFQVTLPPDFQADDNSAEGKESIYRATAKTVKRYGERKKDWCPDWKKTPATGAGQDACDYDKNKIALPDCR